MVDKKIRIILDSKGAKRNADELNGSVKNVGQSADRSQFSLTKMASAIAAVISVQKVVQFTNVWTDLNGRIRNVTGSATAAASVMEQIVEISNRSFASLETTAEAYLLNSKALEELGFNTQKQLDFTESLALALVASGAKAERAASVTNALSKAIAGGVLRGEEFNTVVQQGGLVAEGLAESLGVTTLQLRQLAKDGKLTSDVVVPALINQLESFRAKADEMEVTVGDAFLIARNRAIQFVGTLNDATGASSAFASLIVDISNSVADPAFLSGLIEAFEVSRLTINSVSDSVGDLSNEVQLLGDIGGSGFKFFGESIKNALPNIKALIEIITVELSGAVRKFGIDFNFLRNLLASPVDIDSIKSVFASYKEELAQLEQVRSDSISTILEERDAILETARVGSEARIAEAAERKRLRDEARAESSGGGGTISIPKGSTAKGDDEVARAQAITKTLQNELALRTQVAQIYREQALSLDQSFYEQQLAGIKAKEAEELAILEARSVEDQIRREESFRRSLENEKIQEAEKILLRQEYAAQQLLAEQIMEEQRTAILDQGVRARLELDKAEYQARLANAAALGQALMNYGQGQSKRLFKIGQGLALAQAAVALPSAVLQSFQNGGGYPWGLIPAAAMALEGAKQIQNIKKAGSGIGGGSGGSVPSISVGGGGSATGPAIPSTAQSPELSQQRRIIDLRGVKSDDKISVAAFAALLEEDGAIVTLESAREDAARRNVIGVSAR